MGGFNNRVAIVVPTKDRPDDLRRMLKSVMMQSYLPDQFIVVDSSFTPVKEVTTEFSHLNLRYVYCHQPSASRQRNMGIRAIDQNIELIGFMDDDVTLEENALKNMLRYWESAPGNVGGCSFNLLNPPSVQFPLLKRSAMTHALGLYSAEKGVVVPSGWQTLIGQVAHTLFVQWLPSGAVVWRREIFDEFQFDEWFDGYSYLEDLDFSYRVGKKYRLCVVAQAKCFHFPCSVGRGNGYSFGKREVGNRIYFVKKHSELSLGKCYLALGVRMLMSFWLGLRNMNKYYFSRALGNAMGLLFRIRAADGE